MFWYERWDGAESQACGFVFFSLVIVAAWLQPPPFTLLLHFCPWAQPLCTSYSGPLVCWLEGATQPSTTTEFPKVQRASDCFCSRPLSFPLPDSPACFSTPPSAVSVHGSLKICLLCWAGNPWPHYSCPTCNFKGRGQELPNSDMMLMSLPILNYTQSESVAVALNYELFPLNFL